MTDPQWWGKITRDAIMRIAPNMSAVAVYAYLCTRVDRAGVCWPSTDLIAEELGVSTRTAQRALRALEDLGEIERVDSHEDGWRIA